MMFKKRHFHEDSRESCGRCCQCHKPIYPSDANWCISCYYQVLAEARAGNSEAYRLVKNWETGQAFLKLAE